MTPDPVVRTLLEDAASWRLLGLLLERPRPGWGEEARALAREVSDPDLRQAAETSADATEGDYLTVIGPGSSLSGREVGHDHAADPGHLLSELAAQYGAFAYRPRTEQPADHVSVEAGFVAYLRLKEAYARSTGLAEAADITAAATARFLDEHVSVWAQPLAEGLDGVPIGHLRLAARAAFRRVGPPRHPTNPLPPEALECPLTCGAGGEEEATLPLA